MLTSYTQEDQCPIIVGDAYDLSETAFLCRDWEGCEGLPGQADNGVVLLSMSAYGKLPNHRVNVYTVSTEAQPEHDALAFGESRQLYSEGFLTYGHPGFASHPTQQLPETYDQHTSQPAPSTQLYYEPRISYDTRQTFGLEPDLQASVVVTSLEPKTGQQGTPILIHIKSHGDLRLSSSPQITLMFAAHHCPAELTRLDAPSTTHHYAITAKAPAFLSIGWRDAEVPVRLYLHDESGANLGIREAGSFSYAEHQRFLMSPPQGILRKRKLSDSAALSEAAAKRAISQQLHSRASHDYITASYLTRSSVYSPSPRQYPHSPSSSSFSSREATQDKSRRRSSIYSGGSVPSVFPIAPREPAWISSYAAVNGPDRKAALSAAASSANSPMLPTTAFANPPLIREINVPLPSKPHAVKAILNIHGDLNSVAKHWSFDERQEKRRLVQFWRSQNGNTVDASFEAVTAEARSPKSTCISCIYWEEQRECFVTSVDAINLLESLVGARFDTMEKNRVRRNLEGMRPITICKASKEGGEEPSTLGKSREDTEDRVDSEAFFKLVMGFPAPKPRHIEKDIKVFPWKTLSQMLTKIMGKYRADYCAIMTTTTKIHRQERVINMGFEDRNHRMKIGAYAPTSQPNRLTPHMNNIEAENYPNSPRSISSSTNSSAYSTASRHSSSTSPNIPHSMPTATTMGQLTPSQTRSTYVPTPSIFTRKVKQSGIQYPYARSTVLSPESMQATAGSQPLRSSWEFGPYTSPNTITGDGEDEEKPRILHT